MSVRSDYPTAENFHKLLTRKKLPDGTWSSPHGFDRPLAKTEKECVKNYESAMTRLQGTFFPENPNGTTLLDYLKLNGGVKPIVFGGFNECNKMTINLINAAADLAAAKASAKGTTTSRKDAKAMHTWFYAQRLGCTATKGMALRRLDSLAYAAPAGQAKQLHKSLSAHRFTHSFYTNAEADLDTTRHTLFKRELTYHRSKPCVHT